MAEDERSGPQTGTTTEPVARGPGGTRGGLGEFIFGFALVCAGGYMLTQQVTVTSGFWTFFGYSGFGLSLIPLGLGVGLLFFNGKSIAAWLLTIAGAVFILAGILLNLNIFFRPTSLFNTLIMLLLLAAGLGIVARSLREH